MQFPKKPSRRAAVSLKSCGAEHRNGPPDIPRANLWTTSFLTTGYQLDVAIHRSADSDSFPCMITRLKIFMRIHVFENIIKKQNLGRKLFFLSNIIEGTVFRISRWLAAQILYAHILWNLNFLRQQIALYYFFVLYKSHIYMYLLRLCIVYLV